MRDDDGDPFVEVTWRPRLSLAAELREVFAALESRALSWDFSRIHGAEGDVERIDERRLDAIAVHDLFPVLDFRPHGLPIFGSVDVGEGSARLTVFVSGLSQHHRLELLAAVAEAFASLDRVVTVFSARLAARNGTSL